METATWCEQFLASVPSQRQTLLREGYDSSECLAYFVQKARQALGASAEDALRIADLAVEFAAFQNDGSVRAQALRLRGQALRVLGRHEEAWTTLTQASEAAQSAGEVLLAAQVLLGAIDSLGWLGRNEEAVALANRLERELAALGAEIDQAKVLANLGSLLYRQDSYAPALDAYGRAGEIFARRGDPAMQARLQANRANILAQLLRTDEALADYEAAGNAFQQAEMPLEAAMVAHNVGYLRFLAGQYSQALSAYAQTQEAFDAPERDILRAKALLDRSETYLALNLWAEAQEGFESAEPIFETQGVVYEQAKCALGKATVSLQQGRTDDALAELERADALFLAQKNLVQQAYVALIRSRLQQRAGQPMEMRREAERARRLFARRRLSGWAAEARYLLLMERLERGEDVLRSLHAIAQTARRGARGWLEARAYHQIGRLYLQRGRGARAKALRYLRRSVAVLEEARSQIAPEEMHVAYLQDKQSLYETMVEALLDSGRLRDIAEALEYVERGKSRLLLERIESACQESPIVQGEAAQRLYAEMESLRARLSLGYHQLHQLEPPDPQRRLDSSGLQAETLLPLEAQYRQTLRQLELLTLESRAAGLFSAPLPTMEAVQESLGSDETLIEFYEVRGSLCAFILRRDGCTLRRNIATRAAVQGVVRRLRYHLQMAGLASAHADPYAPSRVASCREVCGRLYDLLLRPLESCLTTRRLIVIPYGVLHGVPFHIGHDGAQYALDRWEFVFAPSAAVWRAGAARRDGRATGVCLEAPALVMAVPAPGIEQVASEAVQVARRLTTANLQIAEQATLAHFRAVAPQSRLLHLATHALFRHDNPLFSGLRFADGWLLARDLYEMTLDCDLVTLSACQTGAASAMPGDELFGLLRGFLAAGARSIAASLWAADDVATATLMTHFYQGLSEGATRARALRLAQQATRESYPHPYHWGAFVLIGQP